MTHSEFYRGLEAAHGALRAREADSPETRAESVHAAMMPLFAATPAAPQLACHRGCSHCCRLPVGVTFDEALCLVDALDGNRVLTEAVLREHEATRQATWTELVGRPCPLLENGACGVYDARPLPCRALGSTDADACAEALSGTANVPIDDIAFLRGLGAASALADTGLARGTRELRATLAGLLAASRSQPGNESQPAQVEAFVEARTAGTRVEAPGSR